MTLLTLTLANTDAAKTYANSDSLVHSLGASSRVNPERCVTPHPVRPGFTTDRAIGLLSASWTLAVDCKVPQLQSHLVDPGAPFRTCFDLAQLIAGRRQLSCASSAR